jgi:hypothetical protein
MTLDEFMAELSKPQWDDKLPSLFGLRFKRWILPHVFIREVARELKWAWQRVYRGWDDRVLWSIHDHLIDHLPIWLTWLRDNGAGFPADMTEQQWNEELSRMIAGFEAARKLDDLDWMDIQGKDEQAAEQQRLSEVFNNGMKSFTEYFFSLWD